MEEIKKRYYKSTDGRIFEDENDCKEYESALIELGKFKAQIEDLNRKIANAEYILYGKGNYIKPANDAGGCGHEGYYSKCPHCGEYVGGYERRNTSLKVDENIYKCEKCGKFFRYS